MKQFQKFLIALVVIGSLIVVQHVAAKGGGGGGSSYHGCGGFNTPPVTPGDYWIDAACRGNLDYLKQNAPKDINYQGSSERGGSTALAAASSTGQTPVVQYLIDTFSNLKFDTQDWAGYTPLINAAKGGHADIFKLLLPKANLLLKDNNNGTALIWAAKVGNADIVNQILADPRATPDFINVVDIKKIVKGKAEAGKTALGYAKDKNFTDVINALTAKGAQ